jgi:hypothetical protein
MGMFRRLLQDLELEELYLHGWLYTWSNERTHPTLERIDRAFACAQWCSLFPLHRMRTLSSSCSDHAPLIIHTSGSLMAKKRFHFEAIWPRFPGFLQAMEVGW